MAKLSCGRLENRQSASNSKYIVKGTLATHGDGAALLRPLETLSVIDDITAPVVCKDIDLEDGRITIYIA